MWKQTGLALCAAMLLCVSARGQNPPKQQREIRAIAARWQSDWNHHDFKALANLLDEDGDYVTDQGVWLRGRGEVANWFTKQHSQMYRHSQWTNNQVTIRFLQPDVAIVHLTWGIRGEVDRQGKPIEGRPGISTWLLVKVGDGWKILAAQDTNQAE